MKIWAMRLLTKIVLKHRLYYWWSRKYQQWRESKYFDIELPEFGSMDELCGVVREMRWRPDDWSMLWDAISDPRATWARHKMGKEAGDCLPIGTLLLKSDYKFCPIELIKVGDGIIGDGKPTRVLKKWFKGEKDILEFDLNNGSILRCTKDHKVFVRRGKRGKPGVNKEIREVKADDLYLGDILLQPRKFSFLIKEDKRDKELAWLEGAYVADGWNEGHRFAISGKDGCSKERVKERVRDFCDANGIRYYWAKKYIRVNQRSLAEWMRTFGDNAKNKSIPDMRFTKETMEVFLEGLSLDASFSNTGSITHGTVSDKLALQIRILYRMLGLSTHMRKVVDHGGLGKNPIWRVTPRRGTICKNKSVKVVGIRSVGKEPVFDIMTGTGKIYLPECDVVVHNCDDTALFMADRIADMRNRGILPNVKHVGLLSCPWMDKQDRVGGHNVCVFSYHTKDPDTGYHAIRWAHVSNWYEAKGVSNFKSIRDAVKDVVKWRVSLGWSYVNTSFGDQVYGGGNDL